MNSRHFALMAFTALLVFSSSGFVSAHFWENVGNFFGCMSSYCNHSGSGYAYSADYYSRGSYYSGYSNYYYNYYAPSYSRNYYGYGPTGIYVYPNNASQGHYWVYSNRYYTGPVVVYR